MKSGGAPEIDIFVKYNCLKNIRFSVNIHFFAQKKREVGAIQKLHLPTKFY